MKTNFLAGLVAAALMVVSPVYAGDLQTFNLDKQHSSVRWEVDHFGFSTPSGKWLATGTLDLDEKNPANSKVEVTIDIADMITGIPELDKHLRGALFFDAEQFPIATFVSDKIEITGKKTAIIKGNLTVRGITKPVTLDVKLNKHAKNPINNKETVGFSATTTIKRSQFGIKTLLPKLGDKVKLVIEVEAYKSDINELKDADTKQG